MPYYPELATSGDESGNLLDDLGLSNTNYYLVLIWPNWVPFRSILAAAA